MSLQCPLCGKHKQEEMLFCEDCTKRIRTDYEVDLPESRKEETIQIAKREPDTDNGSDNIHDNGELSQELYRPKKKTGRSLLWFMLTAFLLASAFFTYNETIRKGNLERSGWDRALKTNSVGGYLDYMKLYPSGSHFEEANSMMMRLKQNEATYWEQLKMTDNLSALRDFLQQYPGSPYSSLVKLRIDSLSWAGALKLNSAAAYSDYMLQVQSGEFSGEYLTMANDRYEMLFQSYPVNETDLDSIRMTVSGFYIALSKVDHDGLRRYLAPVVDRFFESGRAPRERIAGELLMAAARTQDGILQFDADVNAVQYEKTINNVYKVNVPLTKSFLLDGKTEDVPGYIVHLELDSLFRIFRIYETKPHPGAP